MMNIDFELSKNKVMTLSEVRRKFSKQYQSILKRKKIKNDTEYYLVRGILADGAAGFQEERRLLATMLAEFEGVQT